MYSVEWSRIFSREPGGRPSAGRAVPVVSRTVWALGFTSLLTDISSEMVTSILPIYLVTFLGMGPVAFGWIDGIQQGAAALVRVVGGFFADRWRRHKEVAASGYALSALCRILLLFAGTAWSSILAIISLDRIGKGIRTAPRDALISRTSDPSALATAFGVHRSLDGIGAMLGPLVAFAILFALPNAFDVLFVASFGVAIVGLGVILIFVPAQVASSQKAASAHRRISFGSAIRLLNHSPFRRQVLAGALLGAATISDSFLFLIVQRKSAMPVTAFPLLFVGAFLFTAVLAVPCGRVADRFGRGRVLIGGHVAIALLYLLLLSGLAASPYLIVIAAILLVGLFYAATDGVLTAMAASVLPETHCGTGLAVLATAVNLAKLLASVVFGYVWSFWGLDQAIRLFFLALLPVIALAALLFRKIRLTYAAS